MPATNAKPSYIALNAAEVKGIKADARWNNLNTSIHSVWNIIGSDCLQCDEECGERSTNAGCIEACIDADRMTTNCGAQGKEADAFLDELLKKYGYTAVNKFLSKEIRLY